jgi:hypothetical protein
MNDRAGAEVARESATTLLVQCLGVVLVIASVVTVMSLIGGARSTTLNEPGPHPSEGCSAHSEEKCLMSCGCAVFETDDVCYPDVARMRETLCRGKCTRVRCEYGTVTALRITSAISL